MPATLVVMNDDPAATPRAREKRLDEAYGSAYKAMSAALVAAGLIQKFSLNSDTPVGQLWERLWMAHCDYVQYCQRRIVSLERTLRGLLACDALTDEQRRTALTATYGARGAALMEARGVLSEAERELVTHYRSCEVGARTMLRTLLRLLDKTADTGKDEAIVDTRDV